MKNIYIIILIALSQFSGNRVFSQDSIVNLAPISFEACYVGDFGRNFRGGIMQDDFYLGMITLSSSINSQGLGLWHGGSINISLSNTHGRSLSSDIIGDAQVVSNIDNGLSTILYSAYYQQEFGNLNIFAGKHDLNSEFMICDNSMLFLNSSAAVVPTASLNLPLSIFPRPVMGAGALWSNGKHIGLRSAVYDASAPDTDELNADMVPSFDEYIALAELEYFSDSTHTKIKAGAFYHTEDTEPIGKGSAKSYNYSVYLNAEQQLLSLGKADLSACGHIGIAPYQYNGSSMFYALGAVANNVYGKYSLGLMYYNMAYSRESENGDASEQVIECTALFPITDNISVQPNIQYIVTPSGNSELDNALIAMLRIAVSF